MRVIISPLRYPRNPPVIFR